MGQDQRLDASGFRNPTRILRRCVVRQDALLERGCIGHARNEPIGRRRVKGVMNEDVRAARKLD